MNFWPLPAILVERCTRCGNCVKECPSGALDLDPLLGPVFVRPQACTFCTDCESVCPAGAIRCELEIGWDSA